MRIRRPDDFHVHLREGALLRVVAPLTAQHFARALVMPNTTKPILTGDDVRAYREEIQEAAPGLEPLMTVKLTDETTPEMIRGAREAGAVAAKLYPVGVTTNSSDGVKDPLALYHLYEEMSACGMVLSLHGETPGSFCLDREADFLSDLRHIAFAFPRLRIVLEHVTTGAAIECVRRLHDNVAATITVHHLLLTLDDVIGDKLQPHHFCKPIPKRPADREALLHAATRLGAKFFLGTDSAPHSLVAKECASGCAGVFTAPIALPLLAEIFDLQNALPVFEAFTSEYGATFYGLPMNKGTLELERAEMTVPAAYGEVIPLRAGKTVAWRVVGTS